MSDEVIRRSREIYTARFRAKIKILIATKNYTSSCDENLHDHLLSSRFCCSQHQHDSVIPTTMIHPTPSSQQPLTRSIVIYQNERLWIGRGFSKKGLFPTERGPFSTEDGSCSWKTLREGCLALLRDDVLKQGRTNTTAERSVKFRRGWSYHKHGSGEKGKSMNDEFECRKGDDSTEEDPEYCGFIPCTGAEDGPTDEEGWSYHADFSPQSLLSPTRSR